MNTHSSHAERRFCATGELAGCIDMCGSRLGVTRTEHTVERQCRAIRANAA